MDLRPQPIVRCGILCLLSAVVLNACAPAEKQAEGRTPANAKSSGQERTPLDEYIAAPDTNYAFRLVARIPGKGHTAFVLEMTSQAWLTTKEVDRPVWKHWMLIVKPDEVATSKSLLFIGGGANGGDAPQSADQLTLRIAEATNSVVAELKMVPNQPLVLHGDGVPRKEDDFIAYTWNQFLKTGDETWSARLPMVKSGTAAMTAVQQYLDGARLDTTKFLISTNCCGVARYVTVTVTDTLKFPVTSRFSPLPATKVVNLTATMRDERVR